LGKAAKRQEGVMKDDFKWETRAIRNLAIALVIIDGATYAGAGRAFGRSPDRMRGIYCLTLDRVLQFHGLERTDQYPQGYWDNGQEDCGVKRDRKYANFFRPLILACMKSV
jgi:hypothetical protein